MKVDSTFSPQNDRVEQRHYSTLSAITPSVGSTRHKDTLRPMMCQSASSKIWGAVTFLPKTVWAGFCRILRWVSYGVLFPLPAELSIGDKFYRLALSIPQKNVDEIFSLWPGLQKEAKEAFMAKSQVDSNKPFTKWEEIEKPHAEQNWEKSLKAGEKSIFTPLKARLEQQFKQARRTALIHLTETWQKEGITNKQKQLALTHLLEKYPYLYKEAEKEYRLDKLSYGVPDLEKHSHIEHWKLENKARVKAEFVEKLGKNDPSALQPFINRLSN